MRNNLIGISLILSIFHFIFVYEPKITVVYTRKNREPWTLYFCGNNIFVKMGGLVAWLNQCNENGFTKKLKLSSKGLVCEVDTHGNGGWEKEKNS